MRLAKSEHSKLSTVWSPPLQGGRKGPVDRIRSSCHGEAGEFGNSDQVHFYLPFPMAPT